MKWLRSALTFMTPVGWFAIAVLVTLVVIWLAFWVTAPGRAQREAAIAHASAVLAETRTDSAVSAMNSVSNNAEAEKVIDQQVQESTNAILSSPGAPIIVDPVLDGAGRRAICMHASAANLPECQRLLHPGSQGVVRR